MQLTLDDSKRQVLTQILAGGFGAYIYGFFKGIMGSLGVQESFGLGGMTMVAGIVAGLVGSIAFSLLKPMTHARRLVLFGVIGGIFFGGQTLVVPSDFPIEFAGDPPLVAMIVGALAGALGGAAAILFQSVMSAKLK